MGQVVLRMEGAKEPNIVSPLATETPNRIVATPSMQIHATLKEQ